MSFADAGPGGTDPAGPAGNAGSATEPPGAPAEVTDPRALRALAHPARLAILQHLVIEGPATATDCAQIAGLSPSACSYHLRALARYGFVEEDAGAGADRRHRPWRAQMTGITLGSGPGRSVAFRAASRLLIENLQIRIDEIRADYLDREAQYSPQWQAAAGTSEDVLHVTPDELTLIREQISKILAEHRRLRRAERPPGARRVHVLVDLTPWFPPDAAG